MIINNYRDANGEAVQPYYAAFMIEFGYRTPADAKESTGGNFEYMGWINARWGEFFASLGIKRPDHSRPYAEQFCDWLEHRATDQLARAHVEAA